MPYYFSGTDCRASGSVSGPIGVPEDHGELWIGGTLVKTWSRIPGTAPQTFTLSAIFDSTHFPSGSMVSVQIKGWDINGSLQQKTGSAVVINRALIYERADFTGGAESSSGLLSGLDLDLSIHDSDGWTTTTFTGDDASCSVFAIYTHGNKDNNADDISPNWGLIYAKPFGGYADYESSRTVAVGSGQPPYNSTAQPPISIAYLFACECGVSNNFSTLLIPYSNYYGGWTEDQCVADYTVEVPINNAGAHAWGFFEPMTLGQTAYAARANMVSSAEGLKIMVIADPSTGSVRYMQEGDLAIYGDQNARLTTVYTGTNVQPVGWFQ